MSYLDIANLWCTYTALDPLEAVGVEVDRPKVLVSGGGGRLVAWTPKLNNVYFKVLY